MAVYFIRQGVTGSVKIGCSNDVAKRAVSLQVGQRRKLLVMRLLEGSFPEERSLHRRFKDHALGGEWFSFRDEMLGDLGLPDLAIPKIGAAWRSRNWPDDHRSYEVEMHKDALMIVGGAEELARRCGVAPWVVCSGVGVAKEWWGALILLMAECGVREITHEKLSAARKATKDDYAAWEAEQAAKRVEERRLWDIAQEAKWIKDHPGSHPWWSVDEANKALLVPTSAELDMPTPVAA